MENKTFSLPFYVQNGGDGSVSVKFCSSRIEAEAKDSEMDEGWGESSAGHVELRIEEGALMFKTYDYVDGKFQAVWKKVE